MHEKLLGKVTGEAFLRTVRIEVINPEHFNPVREHLKTGSAIVYFDHFAKLDTIVYGKIIRDNLTSLDNAACWVAMKYVDPSRNKTQSTLLASWEKAYGLTLFPIVQTKDIDSYPNPREINYNSVKRTIRYLRTPGNVLGVAPEGTRSDTGQLLKAEEGFDFLLKMTRNVLVLPLAGVHSKVLPVLTKTRVIVGQPFSYDDIKREQEKNPDTSISDLAMMRIAQLLPEENRGYYRQTNI